MQFHWALHCTICLFKDNKACNSVSAPVSHQSNYLLRRLATGSSHQGTVIGGPFNYPVAVHQSGIPNKYPKGHHSTNLPSGAFGICSGYRHHGMQSLFQHTSSTLSRRRYLTSFHWRGSQSETCWDIGSNQACCVYRANTLSHPAGPEDTGTSPKSILSEVSEPVQGGTSRSSVVALQPALPPNDASVVIESDASKSG